MRSWHAQQVNKLGGEESTEALTRKLETFVSNRACDKDRGFKPTSGRRGESKM
jgi:hypothetical protein